MAEIYKRYKRDFTYSYTFGAFPTYELLRTRPQSAREIFLHSKYTDSEKIMKQCEDLGIPITVDDKLFARLSGKENVYVIGVFEKYGSILSEEGPHVVLCQPGDQGNLGTILRTILGFGVEDLAIITPGADIFSPKTVRASMGAIFGVRHSFYGSIEEYISAFPKHTLFPFMTDGEILLDAKNTPKAERFSLIFGNEAAGLPAEFRDMGTPVKLAQTDEVDSLNLSVAVGIGCYLFMTGNELL